MTKISIIVCTYNGQDIIEKCLGSILKQTYLDYEIIFVDGGSSDRTKDLIKIYMEDEPRIKIIDNPKKLPEGKGYGKWLAFRHCTGDIIGIIDQDNILQDNNLFLKVVKVFEKKPGIIGILGGLMHDKKDKLVTRYVSLFGTDSYMAYRSVDFLRRFNESGKLIDTMKMSLGNMPLTGGNCFFYLKKSLNQIGGYDQDVLVVQKLIETGKNEIVILPDATKHYAEKGLWKLIAKKFKWAVKYADNDSEEKFNYLPKTWKERGSFSGNLLGCIFIIPKFIPAFKIFSRKKDLIALLFPFVAFLNVVAYARGGFKMVFKI